MCLCRVHAPLRQVGTVSRPANSCGIGQVAAMLTRSRTAAIALGGRITSAAMIASPRERRSLYFAVLLSFAVAVGGTACALWQWSSEPTPQLRHPAITTSALTTFALYAGACGLAARTSSAEWRRCGLRFRAFRITWLFAVIVYGVHVVVAFHLAHRWSLTAAFAHVQSSTGFGAGLLGSFAFTLAWVADGAVLLVAPVRYANRRPWVGWLVHGSFAFIMVNATVVFGRGVLAVGCGVAFVVLAVAWLRFRSTHIER